MSVWTRTRRQLGIGVIGSRVGRQSEVITHTEAGPDLPASATVAQEVRRVRAIHAYHLSLGWVGYGYNGTVCQSGRAYEGRGGGRDGAHTVGQNSKPAIVVLGHGDRTPMSAAAIDAHRAVQRQWIDDGHLTPEPDVTGHRDYANKSCPGRKVYPQLPKLRGVTGTPAPDPTPEPEPGPLEEDDDMHFRIDGGSAVYLYEGCTKAPVADPAVMEARYGEKWRKQVVDVDADSPLAQLPTRNPDVMFKERGQGKPTTWVTEVRDGRLVKRAIDRDEFDARDGADTRVSVPAGHWLLDLPDVD